MCRQDISGKQHSSPVEVNVLGDPWGVEVDPNIEINPWLHVTPDLQLVMNENNGDDLAVIPGVRAAIEF